jgi:hypothetical protein
MPGGSIRLSSEWHAAQTVLPLAKPLTKDTIRAIQTWRVGMSADGSSGVLLILAIVGAFFDRRYLKAGGNP